MLMYVMFVDIGILFVLARLCLLACLLACLPACLLLVA